MRASQDLLMNQQAVFLSDGGDTVRDLQMRMSPQNAEAISTAFVESTVDQIVSRWFAKKQQMR